mmetsp:Transcript_5910/g.16812  ORF Transcript_5910/g.16812 Transcript_5910/m.16812 type:complete len:219 (+) Transcript_5910:1984-2640(+)
MRGWKARRPSLVQHSTDTSPARRSSSLAPRPGTSRCGSNCPCVTAKSTAAAGSQVDAADTGSCTAAGTAAFGFSLLNHSRLRASHSAAPGGSWAELLELLPSSASSVRLMVMCWSGPPSSPPPFGPAVSGAAGGHGGESGECRPPWSSASSWLRRSDTSTGGLGGPFGRSSLSASGFGFPGRSGLAPPWLPSTCARRFCPPTRRLTQPSPGPPPATSR